MDNAFYKVVQVSTDHDCDHGYCVEVVCLSEEDGGSVYLYVKTLAVANAVASILDGIVTDVQFYEDRVRAANLAEKEDG